MTAKDDKDHVAFESEFIEEVGDERTEKRRAFLKTAASVAVTTSAVTLMLSAGSKSNKAVAASPDGTDGESDAAKDPADVGPDVDVDFNFGDGTRPRDEINDPTDFQIGDSSLDPADNADGPDMSDDN